MTPSEFKSWFEGFTEAMDSPPSLKQWERIQARVKEISGQPITERHYIDRYWPSVRPYWSGQLFGASNPIWNAHGINTCNAVNSRETAAAVVDTRGWGVARTGDGGTVLNAGHCDGGVGRVAFDSHAAMNALGKADAQALAA